MVAHQQVKPLNRVSIFCEENSFPTKLALVSHQLNKPHHQSLYSPWGIFRIVLHIVSLISCGWFYPSFPDGQIRWIHPSTDCVWSRLRVFVFCSMNYSAISGTVITMVARRLNISKMGKNIGDCRKKRKSKDDRIRWKFGIFSKVGSPLYFQTKSPASMQRNK